MSLGVLNNIAAIYAQNNLNQTQSSLQNTLTQLSSGSRINSGADDAAGLAVADGLHANEAALTQSSQNASDGVGLLQTADGALSQVTNLLNRAVTLATEAANGTLNSSQVSAANQEYQNILTQIGNIGSTTNFNSNAVFSSTAKTVFVSDGTSAGSTSFTETVGSLTAASVGVSAPTGTTATLTPGTVSPATSTSGSSFTLTPTAGSTFSGTLKITLGAGTATSLTIAAGSTSASVAAQINANTTLSGEHVTAAVDAATGVLTISGPDAASSSSADVTAAALSSAGSSLTSTATLPGAGVDFAAGAATDISALTAADASSVLTGVTTAIADVAYQRGVIGADINQLNSASNVASAESENLTSAESNIRSTNYGQATSDLAKYQVLSQTGISALAQANSVQQEVLKLLQ